jgi:hypothetical protein
MRKIKDLQKMNWMIMLNHHFGFLSSERRKYRRKLIYSKSNFIFIAGKRKIYEYLFDGFIRLLNRSSSDTTQKSCEPQAILEELISEFNRLCRTINQV